MEKNINTPQSEARTEHYFDVLTGQLLLGRVALNYHLESGGHAADVRDLGELLRDNDYTPSTELSEQSVDWSKASNEEYKACGRWLIEVADLINHGSYVAINQKLIKKANRLGLAPTRDQIMSNSRFGSLGNFYIEIGEPRSLRKGVFKDWTTEDFIQVLQEVDGGDTTWTYDMLDAQARVNPLFPDADTVKAHFDSIGVAFERAKVKSSRPWKHKSNQDFLNWGIKFAIANNGAVPTQSNMKALAKQDIDYELLPPPVSSTVRRFRKFSDYQKLINLAYQRLSIDTPDFLSDPELLDKLSSLSVVEESDSAGVQQPEIQLRLESFREDAIAMGADYIDANKGALPDDNHLNLMHKRGMLAELFELSSVFKDVESYHSIIQKEYESLRALKMARDAELLSEIKEGLADGSLPLALFHRLHDYSADTNVTSLAIRDFVENNLPHEDPRLEFFKNSFIASSDALSRYAKFKVVNEIFDHQVGVGKKIIICSVQRSRNFNREIMNASGNTKITTSEIETTASTLDVTEYVYPEIRKELLSRLKTIKEKIDSENTETPSELAA